MGGACLVRGMSSEEEVFEVAREEESPAAEGDPAAAVEGTLDQWVLELIARVGAGEALNANDKARLPVALQLQAQHHATALQAQAEAAAAKVARAQSQQSAEILKQLHAVQASSTKEIAAVKAELEAVKRGKEEDLEPEHREFVPRAKGNPFGVTGTTREGDEAEPQLRAYGEEVAFKYIELKGGKDFHNFQALESAAEAIFDIKEELISLFPFVVEKVNPDGREESEAYEVERRLCSVFNTVSATYDNVINPQLSYLQLEAVLKKKHNNSSDSAWINQLLNAVQRQLHGVVGTPLPENLAPKFAAVISDLESRFSKEISKQAAVTAARSSSRSPFQSKASGTFGSTVQSRAAARVAAGGPTGQMPRRG